MKHYFFIALAILFANAGFSQEKQTPPDLSESPKFVIKTNALYWLTTTPNAGFETAVSDKLSVDVSINFNPWKFGEHARFQHFLIQPELRYWTGRLMQGHFVGFHAYYAHINAGFLPVNILRDSRKEGNMYGAGASYGYNWRLSAKWRLECVAGLGYAHLNYLVYQKNGEQTGGTHYYNYAGPTKLAVNLIYIIK